MYILWTYTIFFSVGISVSAVVTILGFAELVASSYEFVQSHACIIVQSAYA